jgi:hypothetical protein
MSYKVYKKRWFILLVVSLLNFSNAMVRIRGLISRFPLRRGLRMHLLRIIQTCIMETIIRRQYTTLYLWHFQFRW